MQKLIQFSFEKMKQLLFPFNFNRWLKILFILWLAGAAGSGGGIRGTENWNKLRNQQAHRPVPTITAENNNPAAPGASSGDAGAPAPAASQISQAVPNATSILPPSEPKPVSRTEQMKKEANEKIKKFWPWILAFFILVGLPLMVLMNWLHARFHFILFDFLVHQQLAIRDSFKRHKELGNSLFKFNLIFSAVLFVSVGGIAALFFFGATGIILGVVLAIVWFIAILIISLGINDFVVPLMYHQNLKIKEAARLFWSQTFSGGRIFLYYLIKIGLKIVTGILGGLIFLIVLIVIGIPTGIAIALLAWLTSSVAALKTLGIILMVIVGIVAIAALLVGQSLATLPIPVFFQCFRLGFVTNLLPQFVFLSEKEEGTETQISGQ